ncbi:hypothetical protein K491DRAFT_695951 [Lophiostoma macrostomum CBS 122681]|uniref:Uncharacterized protein n=1 Tax=Lophiostoma macrostomum CBS 122681 TaxID=1314788 RepID=A0A6A6SWQ4_9PLEO|nr:hypothetical protein K491DRAFT_695951 [Lophiostoma macrostomum CBS 122681]
MPVYAQTPIYPTFIRTVVPPKKETPHIQVHNAHYTCTLNSPQPYRPPLQPNGRLPTPANPVPVVHGVYRGPFFPCLLLPNRGTN